MLDTVANDLFSASLTPLNNLEANCHGLRIFYMMYNMKRARMQFADKCRAVSACTSVQSNLGIFCLSTYIILLYPLIL